MCFCPLLKLNEAFKLVCLKLTSFHHNKHLTIKHNSTRKAVFCSILATMDTFFVASRGPKCKQKKSGRKAKHFSLCDRKVRFLFNSA